MVDFIERLGGVEVLWLYGSRATGSAREDSDYDFAVAFVDVGPHTLENRLRPESLALDFATAHGISERTISVVDINRVPLGLGLNIIRHGFVPWASKPSRIYQEESRITSLWEDARLRNEYA